MNFNLTKQTRLILLFTLAVALLGGVFYGGYRYWQSQQAVPEPQEPIEEKVYEIIDNPDGSHAFMCYKYSYQLTYPESWEFLDKQSQGRSAQFVFKGGGLNDSLHIVSGKARDETRFLTLGDFLTYLGYAEVPAEPNFEVFGAPAYKYSNFATQDRDTIVVGFEYNDITFMIYLPWEKRDDPEYVGILNSFKFMD